MLHAMGQEMSCADMLFATCAAGTITRLSDDIVSGTQGEQHQVIAPCRAASF